MGERYLSLEEAARLYDRIGPLQDTHGFYERRAVDASEVLVARPR